MLGRPVALGCDGLVGRGRSLGGRCGHAVEREAEQQTEREGR